MRGAMIVCVLTLLIAPPLAAQTPAGGGLIGVARDEQGAAVPGVAVTARSENAPGAHRTATDRSGQYRLADLPPGEYEISAELAGFATFKRPGVVVRAGLTVSIDVTMKVGAIG
jgi:hypothetical protein